MLKVLWFTFAATSFALIEVVAGKGLSNLSLVQFGKSYYQQMISFRWRNLTAFTIRVSILAIRVNA